MKRIFKIMVATTALCSSMSVLSNDYNNNHHDTKVYSFKNMSTRDHHESTNPFDVRMQDQKLRLCCDDPNQRPNHAHYIKDNYPFFHQILTQNSPRSNANKEICIKGMLCFSGLSNLDLQYSDRIPELFNPNRSAIGVGVRPMFGEKTDTFIGSLENVDLFIDAAVNNWVVARLDLAYVNANRKTGTYSHDGKDYGSVYRNAAGLRVNEAYFVVANPAILPLYIKIGRFMSSFGDYQPYPIIPTLPQLLSEMRTGGVVGGFILDNGFYGSVQWTMAQQSLADIQFDGGAGNRPNLKDRNYGAKLGYSGLLGPVHVHANASYTYDLRDSDYLLEGANLFNDELREFPFIAFVLQNQFYQMERTDAYALHLDVHSGELGFLQDLGLSVDYIQALNNLNLDTDIDDSKIWAFDVHANITFPIWRCPTELTLGYGAADNAQVYTTVVVGPLPMAPVPLPVKLANVLPDHRYYGRYLVHLMPNVDISVEWVQDHDFDENKSGSGQTSNLGLFRVSFQF